MVRVRGQTRTPSTSGVGRASTTQRGIPQRLAECGEIEIVLLSERELFPSLNGVVCCGGGNKEGLRLKVAICFFGVEARHGLLGVANETPPRQRHVTFLSTSVLSASILCISIKLR